MCRAPVLRPRLSAWCVVLGLTVGLGFLVPNASAVQTDAFSYVDEFLDSTGLGQSTGITVYSGHIEASASGAAAATGCIALTAPSATFVAWSFLDVTASNLPVGTQATLTVETCAGTLLVDLGPMKNGCQTYDLSPIDPTQYASIRLRVANLEKARRSTPGRSTARATVP